MTALLAIAALFAYLLPGYIDGESTKPGARWWKTLDWHRLRSQWGLFLLGIPLAVAANILRVAAIAVVGNNSGQAAAMKFHDYSSFVLFPLTIGGLLFAHRLLSKPLQKATASAGDGPAGAVPPANAGRGLLAALDLRRTVAVLGCVAIAALAMGRVRGSATQLGHFALDFDTAVPHQAGAWSAIDEPMSPRDLEVLKPDSWMQRLYTDPTGRIAVSFLVVYGHEKDTFHNPDQCIPASGAPLLYQEVRQIQLPHHSKPINANLRVYGADDVKGYPPQAALFFFVHDGETSASLPGYIVSLLQARVMHTNPTGALVRLMVGVDPKNPEPSFTVATNLLDAVYPSLDTALRADNSVRAAPTGRGSAAKR
jgi:EpsI family protein